MGTTRTRTAVLLAIAALLTPTAACRPAARSAPEAPAAAEATIAPDPVAALTPDPAYASAHPAPYSWAAEPGLIAHGMGAIGGQRVTNCLEAFQANYAAGYRVFEVDLILSTDGRLVARHDWESYMYEFLGQKVENPDVAMSEAEFKALKIHGRMTPLTIADVVAIMKAYPDVWMVTDTKSKDAAEITAAMNAIVEAIGEDSVLAERFIIQIYDEPMLGTVRAVHDFENIAYTLYQLEGTEEEALAFAKANGVKVIVISEERSTPALLASASKLGLVTAVHTVNDAAEARRHLGSGATLIYSDFLRPGDL